jgi:hypothetical protein
MKTREILPVRSNYPHVEEQCHLYRRERSDREPKSKLPHPSEVALRMEIAVTKAALVRSNWHHELAVAKAKARIAEIEQTWPELRAINP